MTQCELSVQLSQYFTMAKVDLVTLQCKFISLHSCSVVTLRYLCQDRLKLSNSLASYIIWFAQDVTNGRARNTGLLVNGLIICPSAIAHWGASLVVTNFRHCNSALINPMVSSDIATRPLQCLPAHAFSDNNRNANKHRLAALRMKKTRWMGWKVVGRYEDRVELGLTIRLAADSYPSTQFVHTAATRSSSIHPYPLLRFRAIGLCMNVYILNR